jgi:hypothetical protein
MTMNNDPYSYPASRPPPAQRERGGCLTVWLTVSIAVNLIAGFVLCNTFSSISSRPSGSVRPDATIILLFLIGLLVASLTCLWAIWNWKRWGVYGIAAFSIFSPFLEIAFGTATTTDFIAPFIQLGILYFLVKDRWDDFE